MSSLAKELRPLVCLPTFNERENLPSLVPDILKQVPAANILIIDDGSPDGTGEWAAEHASGEPRLHLLQRERKTGLGSAYRAGWNWGLERSFDPIITMDADHSHNPKYLPELLEQLKHGADLSIGSRYVPGGGVKNWPLSRRILSRCANALCRGFLRLPAKDSTAGFRAYRSHVLTTMGFDTVRAEGYSFLEESLWRVHHLGFQVHEIPILFEERREGESKINRLEIMKGAWTLVRLRFSSPPRPSS